MIKQELSGDASTVLGLLTLYSVKRLLTVYIFVFSGYEYFGSVVYRGRVSVDARNRDDDFIGFVFSYQSNKRFYVVSWKRHVHFVPGRPGLTIMVTFTLLYCCVCGIVSSIYYREFTPIQGPAKGCKMLFGIQFPAEAKAKYSYCSSSFTVVWYEFFLSSDSWMFCGMTLRNVDGNLENGIHGS